MASVSRSNSRRSYSWWWDSHISPKNSKWLQENLQDMDGKVKSMIKLIEEDADSFARRAEMYYKKRPELMKLVEEFYRAYRALAERYNHAAGELHHAQCAMAESFTEEEEEVPLDREPSTPEMNLPIRALFNETRSVKSETREGNLTRGVKPGKQEERRFHDEVLELSNKNRDLTEKVFHETERAGKAESEVHDLKIALSNLQVELDMVVIQYQQWLKELSVKEEELDSAQKDLAKLDEISGVAELEIRTLKESLVQIEAEKAAALVKHMECLEKISNMEAMISLVEEDRNGLGERAIKAENEAQSLKDEIARLILENESILDKYTQCLAKISELERIISGKEDDAKKVQIQAERADIEIAELKKIIAELNDDKEASAHEYEFFLETVNKLEADLSAAKVNVKDLEDEIMMGNEKLKSSEENRNLLGVSNQSLRLEADNLAKEIVMKDQELSKKEEELEKFQTRLKDEQSRCLQLEVSLGSLQTLNSRSQDEGRALELELKTVIQTLKGLEDCKKGLEMQIRQVRDENSSLIIELGRVQNEIDGLREMKQRLEKEVSLQMGLNDSLQQQICALKEEIDGLNASYEALIEEVKAAGLNPKCVGASLKILEEENAKLRNVCENGIDERELLSKKLESIEMILIEKSTRETEGSHEKGKDSTLREENAALVAVKASLSSQLQTVTDNMHRLLEKNAVLENSLFSAKIELEGLREKSKGLEEICGLLKNERSHLLTERGSLALKLENVERKLETLEKRYVGLEEENAGLLKEKEAVQSEVERLKLSLNLKNQEQENALKKNKYEEELESAFKSQFEITMLKKFMKDMEEKNFSLVTECQKHVEASKMAERVITELESESLEQQVETELLLDEIERLRSDIYQVFTAIEAASANGGPEEKIEDEKMLVNHILGNVEKMKRYVSKHEEDKHQLSVENSILLTVLEQLESKGVEIESEKVYFEHEFIAMARKLAVMENEKENVLEMNRKLKSEAYAQANEENKSLVTKFSDRQSDPSERENRIELKRILDDLVNRKHEAKGGFEEKMSALRGQLEFQKTENFLLTEAVLDLENEMQQTREYNVQMEKDTISSKDRLARAEEKLFNTERKLKAAENLNSTLCRIAEKLRAEIHQSLCNEMEEKVVTEQRLSYDLGEKNDELQLWESEAEAFYFDLQVSSVHEVIFQDKVQELTGLCKNLEDERMAKLLENEEMRGKIVSMENEIGGLKSELNAYSPIITSLRDDVAFLEHQTLLKAAQNETQFLEVPANPRRSMAKKILVDQSFLSLQKLQTRVKAVRKLMEEMNRQPILVRRSNLKNEPEPPVDEVAEFQPRHWLGQDRHGLRKSKKYAPGARKLRKIKNKATEVWNGMLMKDINVSKNSRHGLTNRATFERWETFEDVERDQTGAESLSVSYKMMGRGLVFDHLENAAFHREMDNRKIHERLASNAKKLEILQIIVENLRAKLMMSENSRKSKNVDFETVHDQLLEAEETVLYLGDLNVQLVKNIDEDGITSPDEAKKMLRMKAMEQARKGSEKIERLHLELQKIDYILLKLVNDSKNKGGNRFLKNKTIILRDFIYNGRKNSGKRKKSPLCGCLKPSTSRNERSL